MAPHIKPAKDLFSDEYYDNHDDDAYYDDDDYHADDNNDKAHLVVNSLPQKKQRKNFIRPFELSVSLLPQFHFLLSGLR